MTRLYAFDADAQAQPPHRKVDMAPLRVTAVGREGKGQVIALGDPWLYSEYLYTQGNRRIAEKLFRKI